jgi:hypothetical protein
MSIEEDKDDPQATCGGLPKKAVGGRGGNMKCAHLIKNSALFCKAREERYFPSLFELAEYCRTRDHRKCPFYLKRIICTGQSSGEARSALP